MIVDVPDGVRCMVYFLPSHDVYTWDAVTLSGSVESNFDAGCNGAPGGTESWPFSLVRYLTIALSEPAVQALAAQ